jgi:hypothetical protein
VRGNCRGCHQHGDCSGDGEYENEVVSASPESVVDEATDDHVQNDDSQYKHAPAPGQQVQSESDSGQCCEQQGAPVRSVQYVCGPSYDDPGLAGFPQCVHQEEQRHCGEERLSDVMVREA